MDWAELVLDYLRVLIWPFLILVLALIFRKQLRRLIDGISEVTAPGNISIKRRVSAVLADAEEASDATYSAVGAHIPASASGSGGVRVVELSRYLEVAESDPVGSITGTWRTVRALVRDATRQLGTDRELPAGAYTTDHVRSLVPLGLSEDMVAVARELSGLRNDVVHGRRVRTDSDVARSYLAAADDLLSAVRVVQTSAEQTGSR